MGIASQLFGDEQQLGHQKTINKNRTGERLWLCVETIWIAMVFMLFIIMGPFAAIAVVPAVISLVSQQGDAPMPKSVESKA